MAKRIFGLLIGSLCLLTATSVVAGADENAKLSDAIQVLRQIMAIPEASVPPALLRNSQGIAIIPEVIKVGFVIGGRFAILITDRNGDLFALFCPAPERQRLTTLQNHVVAE